MSRILLTLLVLFSLTGCIYQSVSAIDIERAIHVCDGLDKVIEIEADALGNEFASCKNKAGWHRLGRVVLP